MKYSNNKKILTLTCFPCSDHNLLNLIENLIPPFFNE